MDLTYPESAEQYRVEVRRRLESGLPPDWTGIGSLTQADADDFVREWRNFLANEGLLAVNWPADYGGADLSVLEQVVLAEELSRLGVPGGGPNDIHGIQMLGNTLLEWGSDEQRQELMPRILSGQDVWCQGFSEPDAGSDLANISTRAVRDGDQWVIDGQKVWTSAGQYANQIFLLARTDPSSSRHAGLSFILCPMDQPGVEVRPIRMISGAAEFNEVFFTEAKTGAENVVGPEGAGWKVAMTLLGFERGENLPALSIRFAQEFERLVTLAVSLGRIQDPLVLDKLVELETTLETIRLLGLRVVTDLIAGRSPGSEASTSKLIWSTYHNKVTECGVDILGASALVLRGRDPNGAFQIDDPGTPNSSASWVGEYLNAKGELIAAGTSEIQKNIIGERVLGLPR